MGHRLHVAKTYTVEYTTSASFSYEVEAFHDLLSSLDIPYSGESWDDQFEVTKKDWQEGIEKLKNLPELETEEKEDIESALKDLREPLPEIIEFMELFLNEADSEHDFMVLSFF